MAKQHVIAVSSALKGFFNTCRESFGGPGVSTDYKAASEREIGDAVLAFIDSHRMTTELEDVDGEDVESEIDLFAQEMERTLALRGTSSENTAKGKLAKAESELAELKAQLAKLQGASAPEGEETEES